MIITETVLTLRDLRGEKAREVRRIPPPSRDRVDFQAAYVAALLELAGVALQWRKDDRYDPAPGQDLGQRSEAILGLVNDIAAVIRGERSPSLRTADISLVCTWEPAADD